MKSLKKLNELNAQVGSLPFRLDGKPGNWMYAVLPFGGAYMAALDTNYKNPIQMVPIAGTDDCYDLADLRAFLFETSKTK